MRLAGKSNPGHLHALEDIPDDIIYVWNIFSTQLLRMYLVIHPTELACYSIWMLFISPESQLSSTPSLLLIQQRCQAFPSVSSPSPQGVLPSHRGTSNLAHSQVFFLLKLQCQNSDSSGVRTVLCFPTQDGFFSFCEWCCLISFATWIPSHFLLYYIALTWFFPWAWLQIFHHWFQWIFT